MAAKTRRAGSPQQRAEREAVRQEKLAQLHAQLADGVRGLVDGPEWAAWLRSAAKFHRYSFRNILLIAKQRPSATTVAGFEAWKAHGRHVMKGERGIQLLAPVTKAKDQDDKSGVDLGTSEQTPQREVIGWKLTYVWDVEQTSGEPLPTRPTPQLLSGQAPEGLWDALASQVASRGFTVERGDCGDANGQTNYRTRTVRVRADADEAQAVKTLAHELGHVLLHTPAGDAPRTSTDLCRGVREVEAESFAFIMAASHGLPTSEYTFAYVATWASRIQQTELEEVLATTAQRVLKAADATLVALLGDDESVSAELAVAAADGLKRTTALLQRAEAARERQANPLPRQDHELLLSMQATAADWYAAQLDRHPTAGDYLYDRGIPPAMTTALRIGYAPANWTGLRDHLASKGHTDEQILAAGLGTAAKSGRVVDRFRDRIMFPHRDEHGTVLGFIGRAQSDDPAAPKYLNSPASQIYSKGKALYGLAENQSALQTGATPVLCEGPFDALAVTLAGSGRYVGLAPSGTALTADQVAALDRAVSLTDTRILVAFDNDEAGRRAACSAWDLLRAARAVPEQVQLTSKDPSALYQSAGPTALAESLSRSRPLGQLVISERLEASLSAAGTAAATIEKRVAALREVAPLVLNLPPTTTAAEVSWLANRLGLGFATVNATVLEAVAATSDASAHAEVPWQQLDPPLKQASTLLNEGRPRELAWAPLQTEDQDLHTCKTAAPASVCRHPA